MSDTPNIVVIGGSYGGVGVAQNILTSIPNVKVTLISTSKDYYFNIAAPRILAKPKSTPLEKVIFPIKDHFFHKYPATQFEFIHATVTSMDTTTKTVTTNTTQTIPYTYLIIASGSHTTSTELGIPVKQPSTDTLQSTLSTAQTSISTASTIVIGGGGAVAVEIAGEIAEAYPSKKLILVSGTERLLTGLSEKASAIALKQLRKLGVEVLLGVKILGEKKEGAVELNDGNILPADLYIPALGVIPNNGFIPKLLLDDRGFLVTNDEQKVLGEGVEGIYGVGDITSNPTKMAAVIKPQIAVVVANLKSEVEGKVGKEVLKQGPLAMFVPIGGKGGVAEVNGWVLWSWVVWLVKGNYFIPMALMISGLKKQ